MGDYPPHAGTFAALVLREDTHAYILWGESGVACGCGSSSTCIPVPVGDQGGGGTSSTVSGHRAGDLHRLHPARRGFGPAGWPSASPVIGGAAMPGDPVALLWRR